jgi:iron complex outermembrane receptor protein
MNKRSLRFACLLACLVVPLSLSGTQVLRGTVTDRSGAVVQGASVQLLAGGRTVAETKTGSNGEFALAAPTGERAEDAYTILAVASGFAPASQAVRLADAANHKLALVLDIAPYRQSVEIQAAAPVNECSLDLSGVRESTAKDLGEALTALDGVWKIRKAGIANDLVIRGFQQNNINVLVDGSRTFGACPGHMDPPAEHVDFDEVDHVDVSKGAFDVANEGSLGAVVNIVTKSPAMGFSVKPSLSVGSFDFFNPSVTASYGGQTFQILGGYSYRTSDPYKDGSGRAFTEYADYSASGKRQHAFDINTGWIEMQFRLSADQQLSLGYTRQQAGLILYPYLTMDSDGDNADRVTLKYSARDLTPAWRNLRVESYFTQVQHDMSDDQRTSAPAASGMPGSWSMAAAASTRTIGGRVESDLGSDFTVGVETYHRNWNMFDYMNMTGMLTVTPSIPDVNTLSAGSFVAYHHAITERWKVTAGVRFDHAQMRVDAPQASTDAYYQFHDTRRTGNSDNYPSGNARLTMRLTKSSELFAGLGATGRIPDAEERYINTGMGANPTVGNPLLPVTRNTEVAAGWSANHARFYVRPQFFYSFLDNYILVNNQPQWNAPGMDGSMGDGSMGGMGMMPVPTARSYTNVDARIYGGETAYGVTLTSALSLNGGGSYSRGTATPQMDVNVMSHNLPEMPPLRVWSALRYARQWAFAEFGTVAVNRQSLVDADLKETPTAGYAVLNVKLGFTHRKLSGSFTVDNLLDRLYYEYLSYYRDPFASGVKVPEPGRNFFGQLRYSF